MEWLTFIIELLKAVAWPVAAVVIAALFRKMLPLVRQLKYRDFEVNFERQIKAVESLAEKSLPNTDETGRRFGMDTVARDDFIQTATTNPTAAVILAWADVERSLLDAAMRNNLLRANESATQNPVFIARALELKGRMDHFTGAIFSALREVRNLAAHATGRQITTSEAIEFGNLADRFVAKLAQL